MRPIPFLLPALLLAQAPAPTPPPYVPTPEERSHLISATTELGKRISLIRAARHDTGLLADVEVYHKAAAWLLRHPEECYNKSYLTNALLVLERGVARAKALQAGEAPWVSRKGRVIRAYLSKVDGSVQPYAVVTPQAYDAARPIRLDVVLHGRGAMLSEISFITQAENAKPDVAAYPDRLELHVFGRTNNAYRWSGETDVFEALESVRSRYKIDPARIVLRGFSMGGAGVWHIGLHHPDRWAAIEAGAGFTETKRYARLAALPPHQELALRIYDAAGYARNAVNVPAVGYGGDQDPQLQASVNIQEQIASEKLGPPDLRALFLVGPGIGHRFHPESKKESDAFLNAQIDRPRNTRKFSFVTYTTRYNRNFWITIDALERHYHRAQVDADHGVIRTANVARITVGHKDKIQLDGQSFPGGGAFEKTPGGWRAAGPLRGLIKRHGLQGPIDDALMDSFLVVRPTGKAVHERPARLAASRLETFSAEYAKWLRADPRLTDDVAVTAADIRDHHLVLFGGPASNTWIAKVAGKLPIRWEKDAIRVSGQSFSSDSHLLVMIYPNPLNPSRYVVLNSGHTFGEREFRGTNALLFSRLGDWAVLNARGETVAAGLFDDRWQLP